jgi:RimJ/RimL family protein N-acetyltransferase
VDLLIESERLLIRRFELRDVPSLIWLSSDPTVAEAASELGTTPDQSAAYIEEQQALQPFERDALFDLAIVSRADDAVIGMITLINRGDHGELGFALHSDHRGQGLATEASAAVIDHAFAALGMIRIAAEAGVGNAPSRRVLERLGMTHERTGPGLDGAPAAFYGISKDHWQSPVAKGTG